MSRPTSLTGIHHMKLPVDDIEKTRKFYTEILGYKHISNYDHYDKQNKLFASLLQGPGNSPLLELRLNRTQSNVQQYWDPIVWKVPKKADLEDWKKWFDEREVQCSKVFTAMLGWVLCAMDPDGKMVKMYCDESHEWTQDYDTDEFWLRG